LFFAATSFPASIDIHCGGKFGGAAKIDKTFSRPEKRGIACY
jgi:hypothetical protein